MRWLVKAGLVGSWEDSKRKKRFKYYAREQMVFMTGLRGHFYQDFAVRLDKSGKMTVFVDCPSDGCTPKWLVANLFYVGIPDGPTSPLDGLPVTYKAFYRHDMILYVLRRLNITGKTQMAHKEFCEELKLADWTPFYKRTYCAIVRKYGPKEKKT